MIKILNYKIWNMKIFNIKTNLNKYKNKIINFNNFLINKKIRLQYKNNKLLRCLILIKIILFLNVQTIAKKLQKSKKDVDNYS